MQDNNTIMDKNLRKLKNNDFIVHNKSFIGMFGGIITYMLLDVSVMLVGISVFISKMFQFVLGASLSILYLLSWMISVRISQKKVL